MKNNENKKDLSPVYVHLDTDYTLVSKAPVDTAIAAIELVSSKIFDSAHEKAVAIFLDEKIVPICVAFVGQGDQAGVTFSARDIVQTALLCKASYVTIIHNHPGVNLTKVHCGPSREDILVTDTIIKACDVVGVKVYDSIIASGEKFSYFGEMKPVYYSIREHKFNYFKDDNVKDKTVLALTAADIKRALEMVKTSSEN